jgi:hypothetical protein
VTEGFCVAETGPPSPARSSMLSDNVATTGYIVRWMTRISRDRMNSGEFLIFESEDWLR